MSSIRAHAEQKEGVAIAPDNAISFIVSILSNRQNADKEHTLISTLAVQKAEHKKLLTKFKKRAAKSITKAPQEQLPEQFELVAKQLRELPPLDILPPRVRSDRKGSRSRTLFIRNLSAFVHDVTGMWLDEQVRVLTEIAFDTADIDVDTIRKARGKGLRP